MKKHLSEKIGRFPFDPARLPFFYGWGVLGFGTLGILASSPGQTVGVSVFTDPLIEALGISRTSLSLAYMIGTIASALALSWAGRVYDWLGGRIVSTLSAFSLALVLVFFTLTPGIVDGTNGAVIPFLVISVGFFLLRFTGQGMLTLSSRNMVMEWFEKRRGLANMILGASISFGFSLAPRIFEDLISTFGWEGAWHAIAAGCAGFALMAFLFYRDSPEAHGLRPDGPLAGTRQTRPTHPESVPGRAFTLPEAKRTYTFWVFAAVLLLSGLTLTAYTFHIVSIFAEAGMGRERAVSVFLPAAIVAVGVEVLASYVSDYVKLKYLAMVNLAGTVTLTLSVAFLAPGLGVFGVIVGQGLMQGVFGILSNVTWPRFFGRAHLGAISGLATAFVVGGTAIGPYLYSFARDVSGSYAPAALSCAAVAVVLIVLIVRANRPE